jgi:hypothetical protein
VGFAISIQSSFVVNLQLHHNRRIIIRQDSHSSSLRPSLSTNHAALCGSPYSHVSTLPLFQPQVNKAISLILNPHGTSTPKHPPPSSCHPGGATKHGQTGIKEEKEIIHPVNHPRYSHPRRIPRVAVPLTTPSVPSSHAAPTFGVPTP